MPTTRPRYSVTETDEVARALDDAARRWPQDANARSRLLQRLIHEGHQSVLEQVARRHLHRRDAIQRTRGALTGVYGVKYLDKLRDEWPA